MYWLITFAILFFAGYGIFALIEKFSLLRKKAKVKATSKESDTKESELEQDKSVKLNSFGAFLIPFAMEVTSPATSGAGKTFDISQLVDLITGFAGGIFSVWGSMIDFVVSYPLCLLGVVAWLFVMATSSAQRMYKG